MHPVESAQAEVSAIVETVTEKVGGPARLRVVLLLAGVLSLQSADIGTVGALAAQLERAFRLDNTEVGLLITVTALIGAVSTLPMGVLADRANRTRLLAGAIGLWSLVMVVCGLSNSYLMLLLARLGLGAVTGAAGPMVASLTGDLFPAKERSRIYGMVLTGELLGTGAGLVVSAELGALISWRVPFFVLAAPSLALAILLFRLLPEPARGGQSWLYPGAERVTPAEEVTGTAPAPASDTTGDLGIEEPPTAQGNEVRQQAREREDIEADDALVLKRSADHLSPWAAALYVLRIKSNLALIASSVLGYFFLAGLEAFAILFAETHYQASQALISPALVIVGAGAVVGTLVGGRLADRLIKRRVADARVLVGGIAFVGSVVFFLPALLSSNLLISLPLFTLAAALVAAPNPALDAARLDVVPSKLWGRAEAVRTFARNVLQAFAPLLFGYISSLLGGPKASFASGVGEKLRTTEAAAGGGLEETFLLMLVPLLAAGVVLLFNRRRYLVDVATADVSEKAQWARGAAGEDGTGPGHSGPDHRRAQA